MSLKKISDESVVRYYENIREQAEADRAYKYHLTASPSVRERADKLREEMVRRKLQHSPIDWPSDREWWIPAFGSYPPPDRDRAEGEEMSDHGGGDDAPPPEDQALSRSTARLLRPRRSYGWLLFVLGVVTLLVAIGVSRIIPVDQLELQTEDESPAPPERPDRFTPEQPVEPFKSLVLDAAQSYLVTGPIAAVKSGTKAKK
jgi:hypothetical protein